MLEQAHFTKRKEDFTCDVCGTKVHGNGYTDHCPECLASKHVDVNPGDRASDCHGVMEPLEVEMRHGKMYIHYRCSKCGYTHRNTVAPKDNSATLRTVASHLWCRSSFSR